MSTGKLINLSKPVAYRTQRNNQNGPMRSCNVTAMCMALEASGYETPNVPDGVQAEDHLADILDTPEAYAELQKKWPGISGIPPREVHAMLEWAVNEKLYGGTAVDAFTTESSIREILFHVGIRKSACLVCGRFTAGGHIVAVVGFETSQENIQQAKTAADIDLSKVTLVIIDDPYGDWHTGYSDPHGNDIALTMEQFDNLTREYNSDQKWVHYIVPKGVTA